MSTPVTAQEEREALLVLPVDQLRAIADKIGAEKARSKEELTSNIMTRAEEQGIAYAGYIQIIGTAEESEDEYEDAHPRELDSEENSDGQPEEKPLQDVPLFDPYQSRLKHFMFTVGDVAEPDVLSGVYSVASLNDLIGRYYRNGYVPREVFVAGADPKGHRVGWVLEKVAKPQFSESLVVVRTLTSSADPDRRTVTGFQADAYLGNLLDDGWNLVGTRFNGLDAGTGGVYLVWFLAR